MYNEATKRIKPVRKCPLQAFVTDKFQLFDTIEAVLKEVGPCQMIITSFSISEEFIRKIYRFKEAGRIQGVTVIIDHKASEKVSKLLNFAGNVFDTVLLGSNHSKVVLLWNDHSQIAIITSQNLTRGNRQESTVITTDLQVYLDLAQDVAAITDNAVQICNTPMNNFPQ